MAQRRRGYSKKSNSTARNEGKNLAAFQFNQAWDLIEKTNRTRDEVRAMVTLSHSSLAHWLLRPDCTSRNISIGTWQLARIYAIIGEPELSLEYARMARRFSSLREPLFVAWAYEAMSRAKLIQFNVSSAKAFLRTAQFYCNRVKNGAGKHFLDRELRQLTESLPGSEVH